MPGKPLTTAAFVVKAKAIHGDRYDYSQTEYKGAHADIVIICPDHGEFLQRPTAHISQKQGCPKCGVEQREMPNQKTTAQFIKEAKAKWGRRYDYSATEYRNKRTKIVYRCPKHGSVVQMPALHLRNGCPFCAGRGVGKHTKSSFIAKARQVHGARYDYSKVKFETIHDKVIIICRRHGEFEQRAANHINSQNGCPQCSTHPARA